MKFIEETKVERTHETTRLLTPQGGYINWAVRLKGLKNWVDFEICEVACWSLDGVPSWKNYSDPHAIGPDVPLERASAVASGFVKWDGCVEFGWDEEERHECNAIEGYAERFAVLCWALSKARELMVELGQPDPHLLWEVPKITIELGGPKPPVVIEL